jgi:hypothetical protein
VIAGGAGGLGRILARWLSREHHARIVLAGRRAEDDAIRALLAELAGLGGEAHYRQADCGDAEQAAEVLAWARRRFGAIHCVAHAIGCIEDAFLLNKEAASFQRVLQAKLKPAIVLDAATADDALDAFICFSSVASLMPNAGQGDYAMGNAFLDHFMAERARLATSGRRQGASLSLNLPLLAEGGIGVGPRETEQLWEEFGMRPLPSAQLIELCSIGLRHAAVDRRGRRAARTGKNRLAHIGEAGGEGVSQAGGAGVRPGRAVRKGLNCGRDLTHARCSIPGRPAPAAGRRPPDHRFRPRTPSA